MIAKELPLHLQRYIVDQNPQKYTPVDQAVWRYIIRQLKAFLSQHAHPFYLEGLEKTGITTDSIPSIESISQKLSAFGWRAMPVSGFIPPAAFMELQALGVLPIASDMRSLEHLLYTPAPDIVHEAAGHAPLLAHPEYTNYLQRYAAVASKAIVSKQDLAVYEAIRVLSDIKECPTSTKLEIEQAEKQLQKVLADVTFDSEATWLSRMNWWTAEYGLIGDLENPKIYGAGLLSSVGESQWCLSDKVKKIPLTIECIHTSYDITEPQPQLFVTPDFKHLNFVLDQLADQMAFKIGGQMGLQRAIQSESVCTVVLNSGLQISSVWTKGLFNSTSHTTDYIFATGPTQICCQNKELPQQGTKQHPQGFSSPLGKLKIFPTICPSELSQKQWENLGLERGKHLKLEFTSGVIVEGKYLGAIQKDGKTVLLSFENTTVTQQNEILFQPEWGQFDLALGSEIVSVYGGPADRAAYGEFEDFANKRVMAADFSEEQKKRHHDYQKLREVRETQAFDESSLLQFYLQHREQFKNDWLFKLEFYELSLKMKSATELKNMCLDDLNEISVRQPSLKKMIDDGLKLADKGI